MCLPTVQTIYKLLSTKKNSDHLKVLVDQQTNRQILLKVFRYVLINCILSLVYYYKESFHFCL